MATHNSQLVTRNLSFHWIHGVVINSKLKRQDNNSVGLKGSRRIRWDRRHDWLFLITLYEPSYLPYYWVNLWRKNCG